MNSQFPAATITWRQVRSSNVAAVGWDHGRRLYVQFRSSSAVYLYEGVSYQRAVACARAKSVGSYLAKKIKPHFQSTKIGDGLQVKS